MLSVIMMSVIMLNVVMLSIVVPAEKSFITLTRVLVKELDFRQNNVSGSDIYLVWSVSNF
jgi:hypothetical protein